MRYLLLVGLFNLILTPVGNLDRIRRAIEKLEYEKAYELIQKSLEKNPANPGSIYFAAILYSTDSFTRFDLDTARLIINEARLGFQKVSGEELEKLIEDEVTQERLDQLYSQIRDRLYDICLQDLSVVEAEEFMSIYPGSPYQETLIFKRDSIVFDQVRKNDSLGVYERFLEDYDTQEFREIAIKRIEELRYQVLVHNQSLDASHDFLEQYPETKFRGAIEEFIFKTATVDHSAFSYLDFMRFTSQEALKKKAADMLYYIDSTYSEIHPNRDSIDAVKQLKNVKLIPAMVGGKFGFHSDNGALQIPYAYADVAYDYKCTSTSDEWLLVDNKDKKQIINKSGAVIVDEVEDFVDLNHGASLVTSNSKKFLYHKNGQKILRDPITDAEVLNGRWIKVKRNGLWALISFSGHEITRYEFADIRLMGVFWVFERRNLLAVYTEADIEKSLLQGGLDLEYKFDDLELVTNTTAIGFRDSRECMINEQLRFLVPWGEYEIVPDESGWYLKTENGYLLYDHADFDIMNQTHPYLETNTGWLALKTVQDWMLIPRNSGLQPSRSYDSLKLLNAHCVYTQKENVGRLLFTNANEIRIDSSQMVKTLFNQPDYLIIVDDKNTSVVDSLGNTLVQGLFEEISFFNDTLLKVTIDGKYGLMKMDSSYLVQPEFDAIDEQEGLTLLLNSGKIGCLDLFNKSYLEATYESRIKRFGANYLAKKDGKFGVVDTAEVELLSFTYDEIQQWNDTSYLVKNEGVWNLINHQEEVIGEQIQHITLLNSKEEESIYKYVMNGKYGICSNHSGFLLEPEFTDIFNVGNSDNPIFFADQHLNKAGFHVVSYVNGKGELLFSKAYTLAEFDRILCDD